MVKIKRNYAHHKKKGQYYHGFYELKNPKKYIGTNLPEYRSRWELRVMKRFDTDPNILKWGSETVIVEYFDPVRNKIRRYFTDFFVKVKNHKGEIEEILIEVKPLKETKAPRSTKGKRRSTLEKEQKTWATNQAKWEAARFLCKKKGWKFQVLTEKDIF